MSKEYDGKFRVRGGVGYASAMFRVGAHPGTYSRSLGEDVIQKMNLSQSVKIADLEEYFILTIEDRPMILKSYDFVEEKRCEDVFAFEKWLESTITDLVQAMNK